MSKEESLQDNKNLWGKNIEWTRRVFQTYKNYPQLLKRSIVRIISNITPLGLLIDIYKRRSKQAGG